MNKEDYHLECVSCKRKVDETVSNSTCPSCSGPLDVMYDYGAIFERLNIHALTTAPIRAVKYMDFYPIQDLRQVVSLHEGGTPLFLCKNLGEMLGMKHLSIKNEGSNPTGAFKDRGTMVELTKAVQLKKKAIICASTGNMAASVSAFAANAKIPCHILMPEGAAIGKMAQILAYGARIIQVRGTYDDTSKLAKEIAEKHNFFLAGDYAFRMEGQKSTAFEIAEQLGWQSPDKVIIPIGCGTHLSAIWKGFNEFQKAGLIDKVPKLIGVQAKGADPLVQAHNAKKGTWDIIAKPQTICSAIQIGNPLDGLKALRALRESKGIAISVADEDILEAEKTLARSESVFTEPSGASPLAALQQLLKQGKIKKNEKVVLVLTGAGLKDPLSALKVLPSPPSTEPNYADAKKFLNYGYYNVYAKPASDTLLWKSTPTLRQLREAVKGLFNLPLSKSDANYCHAEIKAHDQKGKPVTESDLKLILESVLKRTSVKEKALEVVDYKVEIGKHEKPKGDITVNFLGKTIEEKATGVGPVDSIINAITKALTHTGFQFKLIDYHVDIDSRGTDAVVEVKMTLIDKHENKVVAVGTSPDIIAASIKAFEEGFNILYYKQKKK